MSRGVRWGMVIGVVSVCLLAAPGRLVSAADLTSDDVEKSIKAGIRYLKSQQKGDGSWIDDSEDAHTGTTSLVTLALLTAGEPRDSPTVQRALEYLRTFSPSDLKNTYAVSLQLMTFVTAGYEADAVKIKAGVEWLEVAQIRQGDAVEWPGSWTYTLSKNLQGDNSNTQYALLGLYAAADAGYPVKRDVWTLARAYWESAQRPDGSWSYKDRRGMPLASMTCAGISSLVITGLRLYQGAESLVESADKSEFEIHNCGKIGTNRSLEQGLDWLAKGFSVQENRGLGQQWRFYYLYGLERVGRLTGRRFIGKDWYREGAAQLLSEQDIAEGFWLGRFPSEDKRIIATSFSLLFLAKGRAPVLINKLRHGSGMAAHVPHPAGAMARPRANTAEDWNNDPDDVRNLVNEVSRDWQALLTWQVVGSESKIEAWLQAPILFFNGHEGPNFTVDEEKKLRNFVEQGGFIFAEACCSKTEFDIGFRQLMDRVFPDSKLRALGKEHAVWKSQHDLTALSGGNHRLFGIEQGCRTVVIYSPKDLSCYWNLCETNSANPEVRKAIKIGQNVVAYATGRELPADKLVVRDVRDFKPELAKRGALQVAKLMHGGDPNVAPMAIPNLMTTLRDKLGFDVVISQRDINAVDPNLANYPLLYVHGRTGFSLTEADRKGLRQHLDLGGGTLFADAACGSEAFDKSFRAEMTALFPSTPLVEIPRDDELLNKDGGGFDLSDVHYSKGLGSKVDFPQLEGIKIEGHWAVIYSKYDIGCALERHAGPDCKGYIAESATRIATNIVIYSMLP